jgi:hypothetical protein
MQTENQNKISKINESAFGLYTNSQEAEKAIEGLEKNGFARDNISRLAPERSGHHNFVYEQETSLKEGALIGAVAGILILGFAGFLWGMSGRAGMTDTMLPFWLISTSAGILLGLLFGTAAGALIGIGMPQTVAKRYGFYLKEGGTVLTVHLKNKDERKRARQILQTTNAQDISFLKDAKIWEHDNP